LKTTRESPEPLLSCESILGSHGRKKLLGAVVQFLAADGSS
jgi:hypothetical protein